MIRQFISQQDWEHAVKAAGFQVHRPPAMGPPGLDPEDLVNDAYRPLLATVGQPNGLLSNVVGVWWPARPDGRAAHGVLADTPAEYDAWQRMD